MVIGDRKCCTSHDNTHGTHMELCSKLQNKRLQQRARVLYERCALLRDQVNCFMRIVCGLYEIMPCGEQIQGQMLDPGHTGYVTVVSLDQPLL